MKTLHVALLAVASLIAVGMVSQSASACDGYRPAGYSHSYTTPTYYRGTTHYAPSYHAPSYKPVVQVHAVQPGQTIINVQKQVRVTPPPPVNPVVNPGFTAPNTGSNTGIDVSVDIDVPTAGSPVAPQTVPVVPQTNTNVQVTAPLIGG